MNHAVILLATAFIFAGCSNPLGGSSSNLAPDHHPGVNGNTIPPSRGAEVVGASTQLTLTSGARFKVQGSVSAASSDIEQKTARGYKLFSNVQGELISGAQDQ